MPMVEKTRGTLPRLMTSIANERGIVVSNADGEAFVVADERQTTVFTAKSLVTVYRSGRVEVEPR